MKKYIIFLCIVVLCKSVYAETIHLKSGQTFSGKIVERTNKYIKVDSGYGVAITYFNDDIDTVDGQKLQTSASINSPVTQPNNIDNSVSVQAQNQSSDTQKSDDKAMEEKKADDFIHNNDCDSAIPILNKLIEAGSNDYYVYWGRGYCLDRKNNYDEALQDYLKSMELNPEGSKKLYKAIGSLYLAKGEYPEAIAQYNKYLTYFGDDGESFYGIAFADFKMGLYDECLNYISKATSLGISDTENLKEKIGQLQYQEKNQELETPIKKTDSQNNWILWIAIILGIILVLVCVYFFQKEPTIPSENMDLTTGPLKRVEIKWSSDPKSLISLVSIAFLVQGFLFLLITIVSFGGSDPYMMTALYGRGPGYAGAMFGSFWISSGIRNIEKEARLRGIIVAGASLGLMALSVYWGLTMLTSWLDLIIAIIDVIVIFLLFDLEVVQVFEREGK